MTIGFAVTKQIAGLPDEVTVGRYHSLIAGEVPDVLEVTSRFGDIVMGVRHRELPAEGVQFHPESVLTPYGKKMIATFIGVELSLEEAAAGIPVETEGEAVA